MLSEITRKTIIGVWDKYVESNRTVLDTRGRVINDIDERRLTAIKEIKSMIADFIGGKVGLSEFKTALDGYNKRNNLWGFTATKGQMFFNQLVKCSEGSQNELAVLLRASIVEPRDQDDAFQKLHQFEIYVRNIFSKAADKRKVPNPGSTGYFLSYFWQIHNNRKWPLMYTSLTRAFTDLEIWQEPPTQKEAYKLFFEINDEIKEILRTHTGHDIKNWDAEHAFWILKGNPNTPSEVKTVAPKEVLPPESSLSIQLNFDISEYLIPKVARLVELGNDTEKTKASQYEKLVAEIFRLLDFDVEMFGQGTGRNPDAIIKHREENTAFIVDAKAYGSGYSLGIDDRAIREYIGHHCPKLKKEGFTKIGFIIVSNSFKSSLDEFVNDITWTTDIKRFILLTSEALLYLLAYKTKDKLNLSTLIDSMIGLGNVITAKDVIQKLDDI